MRRICALVVCTMALCSPAWGQERIKMAWLRAESAPPGVFLKLGEADSVLVTPADTLLAAGGYTIEAVLQGHEPLVHAFSLAADDTLVLRFLLLPTKPESPTADELGLVYEPVTPLIPEENADRVRRKFTALAEIFLIVPLAQGIMATVVMGDEEGGFSKELIVAGVGLSTASYLLGRVLGSRKRDEIRRQNSLLTAQNANAEQHNRDVEIQVQQVYADAMKSWEAQRKSRGRVEVVEYPDSLPSSQGRGPAASKE